MLRVQLGPHLLRPRELKMWVKTVGLSVCSVALPSHTGALGIWLTVLYLFGCHLLCCGLMPMKLTWCRE